MSKIPLRKRISLNLFSHYKNNSARLHDLTYLFWECTLKCNLNCIHCGSDCSMKSDVPDMPLNHFLKVLDSISESVKPEKLMLALTGGEPTLRKDLAECGQEFQKRGFNWGMVTNGWLLDKEKLDELMSAGLKSVTVSIDGLKESHDSLRGVKGSFDKALSAASLIAKQDNLLYDVASCIHKENVNELDELYELFFSLNIKRWRIFTIFPKGRANQFSHLLPDKNTLRKIFDFIAEKRKNSEMLIEFGCEGYLGNYEGEVRNSFFFCRAGINIGSVLADGSVSACPSLRSDFIQGNIYKDDFMDIWNNKFEIMRNRQWTKTGICNDCDAYKYCCGNGLHLRNEESGELLYCAYKTLEDQEL